MSVGRGLEISGNPGAVLRLTENSSGLNHFEIRSVASGSGNMLQFGEDVETFLTIRSDDDGGGTSQRGNVGIGTTSPSLSVGRGLEISGNPGAVLRLTENSSGLNHFEIRSVASGSGNMLQFGEDVETFLTIRSDDDGGGTSQRGNVGIGTTSPTAKLEVVGRTKTQVLEITGGSDLAEPFEISESEDLPPGSVVIIDEAKAGALKLSDRPYDSRVAGVLSGAGGLSAGITLGHAGFDGRAQNLALSGRAYALATAANGPIQPGDLLTTSSVPGHAMKATDDALPRGAVIGKAMSRLDAGDGLVLVLIQPQ